MTDLAAFPIASRWPAQHPDRIDLYLFPALYGVKISVALGELGLAYEAHARERVLARPAVARGLDIPA